MTVLINGHSFHYEMENLCRLFFHHQQIHVLENGEKGEDSILLFTGVSRTKEIPSACIYPFPSAQPGARIALLSLPP